MKKHSTIISFLLVIVLLFSAIIPQTIFATAADDTVITGLKTNDFVNPVGIDSSNPSFSWRMESSTLGQCQTAYEIIVAKDDNLDQIVWNSQKQIDDKSIAIQYSGEALNASTVYYWQVSVWDKDGDEIKSDIASFETGLLGENPWGDSEWIQVGSSTDLPSTDETNYTIEADIQIAQTSVSLLFEASDKQNFLMWQFNNKNGYMEFKPHFLKNGGWGTIRAINVSEFVNELDTDVQKLKIIVTNQSIETYLNGNHIETINASELGGIGLNGKIGRLGFRSHSLEVEAGWMDNIIVTDYALSPQGIKVKSYDFEDGLNPFDDGAIENGRLNTKYTSTETIALEKEDVSDDNDEIHYTVEADVTCTNTAVSLIFNAKNNGNFYMLQLNIKDQPGKILFKPHTWKNGAYATYRAHQKDVTSIIGSVEKFANEPAHVKIDITETEIKTYIEGQLVDTFPIGEISDQGTTGINPQIGYLGFRADLAEAGTVDNFKLTDYSAVIEGNDIYDYDFDEVNPFLGGRIEDGKFYVYGVGILLPMDSQGVATFRKEITPNADLVSAKLYTAGLGVYDVYIDGERVGTKQEDGSVVYDELKPGYTHHSKRTIYSTYDVTDMLQSDETSTISAFVTSGWWSGDAGGSYGKEEAFRAQLLLTYSDGSQNVIGTNRSWKTSLQGPVLYGDIYHGETYNANADISFRKTGYDDTNWYYADINKEFSGIICSLTGPMVQVREDLELTPKSTVVYDGVVNATDTQYGKINVVGDYRSDQSFTLKANEIAVIDLGQNFAGWDEITVEGDKGTMLTMRHAEMLNDNDGLKSRGNDGPEGSVYTANLRSAKAISRYIMSGDGVETYHSTTSFYGFQYLEIATTNAVTIHGIKGLVVTSVAEDTGSISTSNEDVNQLISNIFWGQYSNYLSVPTDCPQRDERKGWTADTQVFSVAASYNGDSKGFLEKYMDDMNDSQVIGGFYDGSFTDTAPYNGYGEIGQLGWADAGVIIPYNLYKMYGDKSIILECYPNMQKFMDVFMASTDKKGGEHNHGDWLAYESNDDNVQDLFGIAYYAWDAQMMAEMANAIGKTEDAQRYQALYEEEKEFFQEMFVNADGSLKRTEQTACLMALKMDLLPDESSKEIVKQALIDNIRRNGNKLQTGFLGTAIIMQTLSDVGATDVAYQLLLQNGNPSWLYSVEQGATTMWERWNSYTIDGGFGPVSMNSFNHYAYGAVAEWMYGYMAGIMYDVENPGFKHIILQPHPEQSIQQVDSSYDSAYGKIVSNWKYDDASWSYEASIPANTTATIFIPVEEGKTIVVNGKSQTEVTLEVDGLEYIETKDGKAKFEAVAGSFTFSTIVTEYCMINLKKEGTDFPVLISINGAKPETMPSNISVVKGQPTTIKVISQNDVDFGFESWTGSKTSNQDIITITPETNVTLTANFKWIGHENLGQKKTVRSNSGWETGNWSHANLVDGILLSQSNSLGYTTVQSNTTNVDYWVEIDLGENMDFNRVQLYPRSDSLSVVGGAANFPVDFSLEVRKDGGSNYDTVETYTNYVGPIGKPAVFTLEETNARYVRLHVTKLGEKAAVDITSYYIQLAEMGIYNAKLADQKTELTLVKGEDDSYITTAKILNETASEASYNVIVATYDDFGRLLTTETKTINVPAGEFITNQISVSCSTPSYKIKAFISTAETFAPICEAVSIDVQ